MIESTLFFALGFLSAGFLALMIAPAIWRRAVNLTRRRIEASVPLTMNEIAADKDRLRAEFAMSTRRLEMSIESFREKASAQIAEIGRNREELKKLALERDERNAAVTLLEKQAAELRTELQQREQAIQNVNAELGRAMQELDARQGDLERLNALYEEASYAASGRQIELVARESEVEQLSQELAQLKKDRREIDQQLSGIDAERQNASSALSFHKRQTADLETRIERLLSGKADAEEKLARREKELAALRERVKDLAAAQVRQGEELAAAQAEKFALEGQVAESTRQMGALLSGATGGDAAHAVERIGDEQKRLQNRLTAVTRENKKLRGEIAAIERLRNEDWNDERRATALLREQINDLAAEVVSMTILLEGKESPAAKALAQPPAATPPAGKGTAAVSLADRVRALQKAALVK
ncbi:MAG: hypothetical protein J0H34_05145 [Rhizobiales bacterium]|nr:hypothetical protein [Hyphomicrobiales bacterium]